METKLVVFDGNALMHRAFHAIPSLTTPTGEPINAVHGMVSMLINVIENLNPTHLAFCFDEKVPTFRSQLLTTYQSQRPPVHYDLASQFEKARFFLNAAKIPVYSKEGFEADDVIGTIATNSTLDQVVVVTGDRDILQLVDDSRNIKLFMPIAGLASGKLFAEAETIERMGVTPTQIPDYKALVGDASDNYFGIAGIGPKTATGLLLKYKTLSGIYDNLETIPEKLKEKLTKGKESAELSYKLATIVRDVSVKYNFDDMKTWDIDSKEVLDLFQNEFGFKTLTERIKKVGKRIEDSKQMSLL